MTREINGVFIGKLVLALHERIHVYVDVRRGGGIVPEGQRPMPVKQDSDAVGICQAPGDIGGGSEAADLQPMRMLWWGRVGFKLGLKVYQVDCALGVLVDVDHFREDLPPGKEIGVMLVRRHKTDLLKF